MTSKAPDVCRYCGLPKTEEDFDPDTQCNRPVSAAWCMPRYIWRLEEFHRRHGSPELPDWRHS